MANLLNTPLHDTPLLLISQAISGRERFFQKGLNEDKVPLLNSPILAPGC
jgi:hypothetical protein